MRKVLPKIVFVIIMVCVLFIGFLFAYNSIGVKAVDIEKDIRSSQKIADNWSVDGNVCESMAAFISYPQDKTDHTFSIYVNHPGLSFGYFFRAGGSVAEIEESIAEFTVSGCNEKAFISMNQQKVIKLETDSGNDLQVIDIDSDKPFAVILPVNAGNITFYDVNGNVVEYYRRSM